MDGVGMTKILYHSIINFFITVTESITQYSFFMQHIQPKNFLYINLFNTCNNDE